MDYSKIDARLLTRDKTYQAATEQSPLMGSPADLNLTVVVFFKDSVEQLEEAGLPVESVYGHVVYGRIRIADIKRLASRTGSLHLSIVRSGFARDRIKETDRGYGKE
jgi:hypothetical protein